MYEIILKIYLRNLTHLFHELTKNYGEPPRILLIL